MFGVTIVRPVRTTTAHRRPRATVVGAVPVLIDGRQRAMPLYHWLGADAERVAASAGKGSAGRKQALSRTRPATSLYHWLGADADSVR